MKPRYSTLPYALLVLAWLAFAAYVWFSAGQLPERVATHFGLHGEPNGWSTHAGYLRSTLIFSAIVPAFILGVFALIRLGNGAGMNIPHKDYWLAPERRSETLAFVQRRGAGLAVLLVAFFAGLHHYVVVANAQTPVSFPPTFAAWAGGLFLAATIAWGASFVGHFYRRPL